MVTPFQLGAYLAGGFFLVVIATVAIVKSRYRKFTSNQFVLFFRNGRLRDKGYGGGYFLLPFIDEIIILTTTVQNLEIDVAEKIITSENQDVRVSGFVVWRIEEPEKAYQSISGGHSTHAVMGQLNKILEDLVESIIRTTVASLSLDQVLRERSLIIEAIMTELVPVVSPMGIKINTAEIRHVEVLDKNLFLDLQEKYRQEARLKAEQIKIETDREVAKSRAQSEQDVRMYEAEQEEKAQVRELAKDKAVLLEQQKVQETDEQRRNAVEQLQKQREARIAELNKKKLEIEAQTRLMEIEFQAESMKRQEILQQIDVEAEKQKRMAEARAEAIKIEAKAKKQAVELEAEAEAHKLERVAEATRKSLEAEAKGRKALLLAEAEGLREKVKAQGYVNDSMIMQDLVKQLPEIAKSMKVGDINWLNMGGTNGMNGDTPLGIIPKNLLEIMTLSKSFGLDVENLIRSVRGLEPLPKNGNNPQELGEGTQPMIFDRDLIINAVAVDNDNDGDIDGFDTDGDGDIDFTLPDGIIPILTKKGHIKGFDLTGDGKVDFAIPEKMKAIDTDGDGQIDGLSLDDDDEIDVELTNLLPMT